MPPERDKYKLARHEHEELFDRIRKSIFGAVGPSDRPTAYFLGGQPGSGKGQLIQLVSKKAPQAVVINGDEYRKFHLHSDKIYKHHKKSYANYTDHDVRIWTSKALEEAVDKGCDFIFEGTMRTNQIVHTISRIKDRGYDVHVLALAVNRFDSMLSLYSRFLETIDQGEVGRYTSLESHDAAYEGMPKTIHDIEMGGKAAKLSVYLRGGVAIYENESQNSQIGAQKATIEGRCIPWNEERVNDWLNRIDRIIKGEQSDGDRHSICDELIELRERFLKEMAELFR